MMMRSLILVGVVCLTLRLGACFDFGKCQDSGNTCAQCTAQCKENCPKVESDVEIIKQNEEENKKGCEDACDDQGANACGCQSDSSGANCARPDAASDSAQPGSKPIGGLLIGGNNVRPKQGACDPSCKDESCKCDFESGSPVGRKKRSYFNLFDSKFIWHQDTEKVPIKKDKARKCCLTTKRVVPFTWPIAPYIFPVYCPLWGGYQWIDQVVCNVYSPYQLGYFQVHYPSGRKCKWKCQKACTTRTYLMTNLPPYGWWGHCFYYFVPTWFAQVEVPTHCYCPAINPIYIPKQCYYDVHPY